METQTRMEFAVHMTCSSCVDKVKNALDGIEGINKYTISLAEEQVIIDSALPMTHVYDVLKTTGLPVVMRGQGAAAEGADHLGAAVSVLNGPRVMGLLRFTQLSPDACVIEGTVSNLKSSGSYSVNIHEFGDLSEGCRSCGDVFNPYERPHADGNGIFSRFGDLCNVAADENGRAAFRIEDGTVKVWDVIGRSVVIHDSQQCDSRVNSSDSRLACGIIARSAGLFQNSKKFCACDGKTLWEDRPLAASPLQASL